MMMRLMGKLLGMLSDDGRGDGCDDDDDGP